MADVNEWDQLKAESGPPGGQAQAQIRSFQLMTAAIVEFNRKSGWQANVMIVLTVGIFFLTCAMLWLGCMQYQVSKATAAPASSGSSTANPLGSSTANPNTVLSCDYTDRIVSGFREVYELDVSTKTARLLSVHPPRSGGSLEVSDSGYRLLFPEGGGGMQLEVEINRFTGRAHRQVGRLRPYGPDGKLDAPAPNSGRCVSAAEKDRL